MSQILPFYLVCDESGSMKGEPLGVINASLPDIHIEIGSHPVVADKTRLCIIGFSGTARMVLPLSDLSSVLSMSTLGLPQRRNSLWRRVQNPVRHHYQRCRAAEASGDQVYRPAVFFLSDGRPTDKNWQKPYQRVTDSSCSLRPNILAFGFGSVDAGTLQRVAAVKAFIAEKGMGPAVAVPEFARSLPQSIVNSGSRPSADGGLVLAVPDDVPGFTTLPADQI